jgi:hypothetical protein
MKKLFMYLAVISMTFSVFAQSPQKMSYQCVVRNASGVLVTNQSVGIKISILQGTPTGTVVYQENYNPNPQTNANGLVSIEIGGGTPIAGTFSAINWASGSYFLKTETDPTGGTNYTISGTSQLLSVPYALHSKTAENGFSGNYIDLTNKPILFSGVYNDLTSKPILFDGTWASLTAKPSFATVATSGSYNDLTNKPALFSGNYIDLTNKPTLFNGTWANITGKPTTLAGYGITDGMNTSHVANGITSSLITNWNTAYSWGNHAGLYRPVGYVPAWNEITGKPTFATVATSGSYIDLANKPTLLNSQWTTSGSNIYYNSGNVGIGTSSPATLIHAHGSPVTSRGQLSLSSPAGQDIFLSFYEANTFKSYLWFNVADQDLRLQNFTAGDLNLNPYGGNVGIGTITPGAKLEVAGQVKITGGTPAAGQILTSDGTGLATWEPPAAVTPNQIYFEVKRDASYDWPTNATVKKIDFSSNSTVWENQGNAFNATTSTFTAPENGIYAFNGAIHFESITAGYLIYAMLTAGGRTYEGEWKYSSSSFDGVTISMTLYLSAGQTAQLWGYLNDPTPPGKVYGNTAVDYAFTFFTGAKVR